MISASSSSGTPRMRSNSSPMASDERKVSRICQSTPAAASRSASCRSKARDSTGTSGNSALQSSMIRTAASRSSTQAMITPASAAPAACRMSSLVPSP